MHLPCSTLLPSRMLMCAHATHAGAGSDLQGMRTTAVADGDDYIINGSKTFITNGWHADLVIVCAKTDPTAGAKGILLFAVETSNPGFIKGRKLKKMGMKVSGRLSSQPASREGGGLRSLSACLPVCSSSPHSATHPFTHSLIHSFTHPSLP
jgi:hypothetical protein